MRYKRMKTGGVTSGSSLVSKKLINLAEHIRPDVKLQPIQRPPPAVRNFFPQKDSIQKNLQSHIVYKINCLDCNASYVGKTIRHAITRHIEHGAPKEPPP